MKISALILAAGEGKRIGTPKAILRVKGYYLADIQYELLSGCGIEDVKIIIGACAEDIKNLLKNKLVLVVNSDYRKGQFSSIVMGVKAIEGYDGLIILPVDTYPLESDVVHRLISEFDSKFDAIIPAYKGKKGHPIILYNTFAKKLLNYNIEHSRLDYILRESKIKVIEVNSPSILNNINSLSDLPV